jgi:chromosome segregation ATPase
MNIFRQVFVNVPGQEQSVALIQDKSSSVKLLQPVKSEALRVAIEIPDDQDKAASYSRPRQEQKQIIMGSDEKKKEKIDYKAEISVLENQILELKSQIEKKEEDLSNANKSNCELIAENEKLAKEIARMENEANETAKMIAEARTKFESEDKTRNHYWNTKFLEIQFELDELNCSRIS